MLKDSSYVNYGYQFEFRVARYFCVLCVFVCVCVAFKITNLLIKCITLFQRDFIYTSGVRDIRSHSFYFAMNVLISNFRFVLCAYMN